LGVIFFNLDLRRLGNLSKDGLRNRLTQQIYKHNDSDSSEAFLHPFRIQQ
jgi:hypothetical protein